VERLLREVEGAAVPPEVHTKWSDS
jgi:hypothetical protein